MTTYNDTTFARRWAIGLVGAGAILALAIGNVAAQDAELDDGLSLDAPRITDVTPLEPGIETKPAVTAYESMIADLQRAASADEPSVTLYEAMAADYYASAPADPVVTGYEAMAADYYASAPADPVVTGYEATAADYYASAPVDPVVTGYEAMAADLQAEQLRAADQDR